MSLVALGSAKGSPGVTTMMAALAARWPDGRPLLVAETDPAGGDLAARLGLDHEPGLVALAAEGRRELTPAMLWQQAQPLPGSGSAQVLTGPVSAEQAGAALSALSSRFARLLAQLDGVDVLADCGRLDPSSPAMALVRAADLVVVVARPSASQMHHLSARVAALGSGVPVALVLVGDRPYDVVEAGRAVGAEPLGTIADDARAAGLLAGGAGSSRVLRASALLRTARTVATVLADRMGPTTVSVTAGDLAAVARPPPMAESLPRLPAEPEPVPDPVAPVPRTAERRRRPPRSRPLQARPHPSGPLPGGAHMSPEAPDGPS